MIKLLYWSTTTTRKKHGKNRERELCCTPPKRAQINRLSKKAQATLIAYGIEKHKLRGILTHGALETSPNRPLFSLGLVL